MYSNTFLNKSSSEINNIKQTPNTIELKNFYEIIENNECIKLESFESLICLFILIQ